MNKGAKNLCFPETDTYGSPLIFYFCFLIHSVRFRPVNPLFIFFLVPIIH